MALVVERPARAAVAAADAAAAADADLLRSSGVPPAVGGLRRSDTEVGTLNGGLRPGWR